MSYILRLIIFSGLLLLIIACSTTGSPADSRIELEENSGLEGNTTPESPQNELATEAAKAGDSPLSTPSPISSASDEDCTLTVGEPSTSPLAPGPGGAPAAPNQSLLTGIVRCVWQVQASSLNIQPEMPIFIAEVEIVEAKDVEGLMNSLAGQEGQTIKIFSKTTIPPDASGRTIEALVTLKGDEQGAEFWIINDQLSIR